MSKLSPRASMLLALIRARTDKDWTTGELRRYWVPSAYPEYIDGQAEPVFVRGAGDMACLKSLEAKYLIRHPRNTPHTVSAYEITEDGLLALERGHDENP